MDIPEAPIILQLAPLPRQQIGPFLILGIDKDASTKAIEAAWAQRLIWARKGQIRVPLEDVNWAREIMNDPDRRRRADAMSFNIDTTDGLLRSLRERYQGTGRTAGAKPIDVEKNLSEYVPATPVPESAEVRQQMALPEPPREFPALRLILEDSVRQPIDPWDVDV